MKSEAELIQDQANLPTISDRFGEGHQSISEYVDEMLNTHDLAGAIHDMLSDFVGTFSDLMKTESLTLDRDAIAKIVILQYELMRRDDRGNNASVWENYGAWLKSL